MSNRSIPESLIHDIRERIDIVDIVSSYLPLKRSGANHQGLCPFHSEKTPSFNVNSTRQIFHCFGCGEGGNVYSFLMKIEGLSFPDAVRRLGEKVGLTVPDEPMSPAEEKRREETELLLRINGAAAEFYHQLLIDGDEGKPARRYLRQRGYDADSVRQFQLGYAPERWEALSRHLEAKGFDAAAVRDRLGLTRTGKEGRGDYDLFRGRLMIPIYDVRGGVVALGGRVLDDSLPKYINSPESPVYHKGRVLYGLHTAREAMRRVGCGIVVEGYFDQMALHRNGFAHAVATCGTALTPEHARLLKRYTDRLLLLFDQDKAGRQAALRAMEVMLPEGLSVAVVELSDGEDPDSFLVRHGAEAMTGRLAAAKPVIEYYMDLTLAGCGDGVEAQARAAEAIADKLTLLSSAIERDLYLRALAARTGVDAALLSRRLAQAPPRSEAPSAPRQPTATASTAQPRAAQPVVSGKLERAQKTVLRMFVDGQVEAAALQGDDLEALFPDSAWRRIAVAALALATEGRPVVDGLQNRLEPDDLARLAALLMEAPEALQDEPERLLADCRQVLLKHHREARRRQLPELLRVAEAAGDAATASELLHELQQLLKKKL